MTKDKLTVSDIQSAIAELMKRGKEPPKRYSILLQGVELYLDYTSFKVHIHIPAGQYNQSATVELEGNEALEWVADACREKAERENA